MLAVMRRVAPVLAAGLVATGLVVLDPSAPSALAAASIPPVVVPSSTLTGGSLDFATAAERARAVGNVIPQGVTRAGGLRIPTGVGAAATKAGGPVMVATTGLFIGFEGANSVMKFAGVDNVGLSALFPDTTVTGYVPNSDARVGVTGWDGGINTFTGVARMGENSNSNQYVNADVSVTIDVANTPSPTDAGRFPIRCTNVTSVGASPQTFQRFKINAVDANGVLIAAGEWSIDSSGQSTACTFTFSASPEVVAAGFPSTIQSRVARYEYFAETTYGAGDWPATPQAIYRFPWVDRFEGGESDPLRAWETRWQCSDSGATVATIRSATFREGQGTIPAYPSPVCTGEVTHVEVWEVGVNGDVDDVKIWEDSPSTKPGEFAKQYPQCTDGSCTLELYRADPTAGTRISCLQNPTLCVDWLNDPARADNYRCEYGGQAVDLSECNVYGPTFNVWTNTPVQTETGTRVPAEETNPYGDPATGNPVPRPDGGGVPAPQPSPDGTPQDSSCPPPFAWNSLINPWWYYKGVTCALSWAFVPTAGLNTAQVSTALDQSVLGAVGSASGSVGDAFGSLGAGSCGVILQTEPSVFLGNGITVDTCSWPWNGMGAIRLVIGTGFILGAVIIGIKSVLRTIRVEVDQAPAAAS